VVRKMSRRVVAENAAAQHSSVGQFGNVA